MLNSRHKDITCVSLWFSITIKIPLYVWTKQTDIKSKNAKNNNEKEMNDIFSFCYVLLLENVKYKLCFKLIWCHEYLKVTKNIAILPI